MLGRRPAIYMEGWMYYFDIGSKFELVGVRTPEGACMIVPEHSTCTTDFEKGIHRLDWHNRRQRETVTEVRSRIRKERRVIIERVKLYGKAKKV